MKHEKNQNEKQQLKSRRISFWTAQTHTPDSENNANDKSKNEDKESERETSKGEEKANKSAEEGVATS